MNPTFTSLNFSEADFGPIMNSGNHVHSSNSTLHVPQARNATSHIPHQIMKTCTFNCLCCARMQLGNICSCNVPKESVTTQTNEADLPKGLDSSKLWKRGTFEHGVLQKLIKSTANKYCLTGAKDTMMGQAIKEVVLTLKASNPDVQVENQKIQQRLAKCVEWQRYYEKKQSEASRIGQAVRNMMRSGKRKRHDDKENMAVISESHEMGVDNRGYATDSDSDDVPLSTLAKKQ